MFRIGGERKLRHDQNSAFNVLHRKMGGLQLRLRIHNHHSGNNLTAGPSRYLFDRCAQVGMRNAQLLRIPCHIPRTVIMLQHQLGEVPAKQFTLGHGQFFRTPASVHDGDAFMKVGIQVWRNLPADFFREILIHADKELHVRLQHTRAFGL